MYTDAEKKVKFNLNNDPESNKPLCTEISWREFFDDATLKEAEHPKTQRKIWSLNKNWEALYGRFAPDKEDIRKYGKAFLEKRYSYFAHNDDYVVSIENFPSKPGEQIAADSLKCTCQAGRAGKHCVHEAAVLYAYEKQCGGLLTVRESDHAYYKRVGKLRKDKQKKKLDELKKTYGTDPVPALDFFQGRKDPDGLLLYDMKAALETFATDAYSMQVANEALAKAAKKEGTFHVRVNEIVSREGVRSLSGYIQMIDSAGDFWFDAGEAVLTGNRLTCRTREGYTDSECGEFNSENRLNISGLILCSLLWDEADRLNAAASDFTDAKADRFFQRLEAAQDKAARKKEEPVEEREKTVELFPRILIDNGEAAIGFRIRNGNGKWIVVRNAGDLVYAWKRREKLELSKTESIDFNQCTFTDASAPLFDFISRQVGAVHDANEQIENRNQFRSIRKLKVTARVELRGAVLDHFYDVCDGRTVEYQDKTNQVKEAEIPVGHRDIRIALTADRIADARGRFAGVAVHGLIPVLLAGSGTHRYVLNKDGLSRVSRAELDMIRPFESVADASGFFRFQVGMDHLQEFYYRVVPLFLSSPNVDFTDNAEEEAEKRLPPEPHFTFWMDLQDLDEQSKEMADACLQELTGAKPKRGEHILLTARLTVSYQDSGKEEQRTYRLAPAGNEREAPAGNEKPAQLQESGNGDAYRDVIQEDRVVKAAAKEFPYCAFENGQTDRPLFAKTLSDEKMFDFLRTGIAGLERYGQVNGTEAFRRFKIRPVPQVKVGISVESGIMDLSLTSSDLNKEELLRLLQSYHRRRRFHRLSSGEFVDLSDDAGLQAVDGMLGGLDLTSEELAKNSAKLPLYRALYVDRLLEEHEAVVASRDRIYRALIRNFRTIRDAENEPPASLDNVLRPYQAYGFKWIKTLENAGFGGILADEMGLGKTLQMISVLFSDYMDNGVKKPSLVICPASLVYNWQEEFERFAPQLKVVPVTGGAAQRKKALSQPEDAQVYVISYDLLKRHIAQFTDKTFHFVVLDEAQYIKNAGAAVSKSVKTLQSDHRFALTGTPVENRLSELWSIFDFLMPGFLYSRKDFEQKFEIPVTKNKDEAAAGRLAEMTGPFILRRRKADVLRDLPEKLEEVRYVPISGQQQKLYDAEVLHMKDMLGKQSDGSGKIQIFAELTRIREICCDPSLLFEDYHGESVKREAVMGLIRQAMDGGHRMLLFSQFTSMLALLEEDLKREKIPYYLLTGATSKEKRIQLVHAFNENDVPVFLISLKAGGTGLNLTGADVVIHYDPWWNLAAQNQATDRAHRIGQTRQVTVYRMILRSTIEEKILKLQETKQDLAESVLSGGGSSITDLSNEELMELLG